MQLSIREAQVNDYVSISKLIKNELGYEDLNSDKLFNRLEQMKSNKNYLTVVAEHEREVVGFIGIFKGIAYNYDGEYIQIIALAVSMEHQSEGIGSKLLQWIEDYAIAQGIRSLGVNCGLHRTKSHAFYEHNGYVKKSYSFAKDI